MSETSYGARTTTIFGRATSVLDNGQRDDIYLNACDQLWSRKPHRGLLPTEFTVRLSHVSSTDTTVNGTVYPLLVSTINAQEITTHPERTSPSRRCRDTREGMVDLYDLRVTALDFRFRRLEKPDFDKR